jgi:hypothetical protein
MGVGADDHAMCDVRRGMENGEKPPTKTREMRTMWNASDLRYYFNVLMNNISCLTSNIKLLFTTNIATWARGGPWYWMRHPVDLVAADAWRSFSPLPIGGEVLSWKKKSDGSRSGMND